MNLLSKTKTLILAHKFISGVIVAAVLVGGYFGYGMLFPKKTVTSYVTATAANGTITTSVSGSGQVAASGTISLQFQASGILTYLPVENGQNVSQGQLIAEIDTTDAEKSVRDAQASLDSAQIALQKLEGASTLAIPQNKQDAINAKQDAVDTLNQDYQSAYNSVSNVFIDLPAIMSDLQNTLYSNSFNNSQQNIDFYSSTAATYDSTAPQYKDSAAKSYQTALAEYTKNFNDYKSTTRSSDNTDIDSILSETATTTTDIAQSIKDANNLIQFYENTLATYNIKPNPIAVTQLATVNTDGSKADADISSLINIQNTLKNDNDTISNDDSAIANSDLDIQSQQLSVTNAQNALQDAKDNLANYYIYAPFSGTVGKISAVVGSNVGSGTSIATLLTTQKICTIPLNEVDAAKVQQGQKVMLTFDALPDLTVAGQVATIDPVGTVTQGVVTYNVQINFDTQDSRVKSGMSINAEIITNVAQNVLVVPNAAVKTQGTAKYVQVLVNNKPTQEIVTVGLSNDTSTQILSGLTVGDKVITQTVTSGGTGSKTSAAATSARIPGLTGGGGGGFGGGRGGL